MLTVEEIIVNMTAERADEEEGREKKKNLAA